MEILCDKGISAIVVGDNLSITKDKEYKNLIFYNYNNGFFDLQINNRTFKGFEFYVTEYNTVDIRHPGIILSNKLKNFCIKEALRIKKDIINFDTMKIGIRALRVYRSIFEDSGEVKILAFARSGLRYYIDEDGITYCEQNPEKESKLGYKAKEGHQILNVYKGGAYLMRIEDNVIM